MRDFNFFLLSLNLDQPSLLKYSYFLWVGREGVWTGERMILERMKRWMIRKETNWAVNEEIWTTHFMNMNFNSLGSILGSMMMPGIICVSLGKTLRVNSNCIKTVNLKASLWILKWDTQSNLEAIWFSGKIKTPSEEVLHWGTLWMPNWLRSTCGTGFCP